MVTKDGKKMRVTITNFGIEDTQPAHKLGRYLAHNGYNSGQAEAEIRINAASQLEIEWTATDAPACRVIS
jgi:hypothetical protein